MKNCDITKSVLLQVAREEDAFRKNSDFEDDNLKFVMDCLAADLDGDAIIYREKQQGKFCYDHAARRWNIFDCHFWREDLTNEALADVQGVVEQYGQAAVVLGEKIAKLTAEISTVDQIKIKELERQIQGLQRQQKALIKRIGEIRKRLSRKKEILELSAAGPGSLGISGNEWDRQEGKLPCLNGVLDLKTAELHPGKPGDFIKKHVPTTWEGLQVPAPIWNQTLNKIFGGDKELVHFVKKLFGYAIAGNPVEHVFILFYGPGGRNGKGTILEILGQILGPLAGQVEAEMLLKQPFGKAAGGPSSDIMSLRGKRVVWASESNDGRRLDTGKVKWLSGGDTLVGREPYGRRQVSFDASHQIFLITNHLPRADAEDLALWSRILVIKFLERFVKNPDPSDPHSHQADLHIIDKLKRESSGILAWLVQGFLAWQSEGLNPPEQVKIARNDYHKNEDLLATFLEECCRFGPDLMVPAGKLYGSYKDWCHTTGLKPASMVWFGRHMKERYDSFRDTSRNSIFYSGIGLLPGQSG